MWKNQRGFSLIEAIIVIAMLGILAGSAVSVVGNISYANTKKAVEELDNALSSLRVDTMSREGRQYLYIYPVTDDSMNNGYYIRLLSSDSDTMDINSDAELKEDFFTKAGMRLCTTNVTIYKGDKPVTKDDFICIAYKKNGVFLYKDDKVSGVEDWQTTNTDTITISGNGTYTITLNKNTGRHTVE